MIKATTMAKMMLFITTAIKIRLTTIIFIVAKRKRILSLDT
jgi:hypothetical protein